MAQVQKHYSEGEWRKCGAEPGNCPIKGEDGERVEHMVADSAEEMQQKVEADLAERHGTISTVKKPRVNSTGTGDHIQYQNGYDGRYALPDDVLDAAQRHVDKANKRLERYGIEERFELETIRRDSGKYLKDGVTLYKPTSIVRLSRPQIGREGYEFTASMTSTPDGKLIVNTRDEDLLQRENVPTEQGCDHCGHKRHREKTYLIRDPEGNTQQVGSTCVDAYMGVKVEGLWALEYDPLREDDGTLKEDLEQTYNTGNHWNMPRDSEQMMAYTMAASDDGKNFVSRSEEGMTGNLSTAEQVEDAMWGRGSDAEAIQQRADEYVRSGAAKKALEDVHAYAKKRDDGGGYWGNVSTLSSGDMVKTKHMGLFVSALGSMRKAEAKEQERKAEADAYVPGFAGEIKEKIKDRKGAVKAVRHYTSLNPRTGNDDRKTAITFTDEQGREMVWFASKQIDDVDAGDSVNFTGGTVKDHKQYKGKDQTVLTRVKFDVDDANEEDNE